MLTSLFTLLNGAVSVVTGKFMSGSPCQETRINRIISLLVDFHLVTLAARELVLLLDPECNNGCAPMWLCLMGCGRMGKSSGSRENGGVKTHRQADKKTKAVD